MPGLEGDLEEWQTQEVNVTRGKAEGDTEIFFSHFLKLTTKFKKTVALKIKFLPFNLCIKNIICHVEQIIFF